jgi:rhomboid family GlyGly-CTERM serine protease
MGLNQGELDHRQSSRFRIWVLPGITVVVAALLAATGEWGREALRYDRELIADGEVWRLLSGHIAHLGWPHFLMNGAGLLLIWYLVATQFRLREWLLITALVVAGIDLGFWLLQPQLIWYVGLSGVLHGLLAAGSVSGLRSRHSEYWLIAAFLLGKLVYEQWLGPLPGSEGTAGGNVIVAAHLYGAVSGALAGLALCLGQARQRSIYSKQR